MLLGAVLQARVIGGAENHLEISAMGAGQGKKKKAVLKSVAYQLDKGTGGEPRS